MKKVLFFAVIVMACMGFVSCVVDLPSNPKFDIREESQDVAIFLHLTTCSYSKEARKYISEKYPNAKILFINIDGDGNRDYLKSAQYYYGFDKDEKMATPIICLGNDCISGWSYDEARKFDQLILPYLKDQ